MSIVIKNANVNNLKNISLRIEDGHTIITGVSGSGKSSLVFDTIYYEARRHLFELFHIHNSNSYITTTDVDSIVGLKPTIAIFQNTINRNMNSTIATSSGLHALLRILYTNYGTHYCSNCNAELHYRNEAEVINTISNLSQKFELRLLIRILNNEYGSHQTLLYYLYNDFAKDSIWIDGEKKIFDSLDPNKPHNIDVELSLLPLNVSRKDIKKWIEEARKFAVSSLVVKNGNDEYYFSLSKNCQKCNTSNEKIEPSFFNKKCPYCMGEMCEKCNNTGLYPAISQSKWQGLLFSEILSFSIDDFSNFIHKEHLFRESAKIIKEELSKRCNSLLKLNLGYLHLNRKTPTLSRGEYQRLQITKALINNLEDIIYLLDEPSIGLHYLEVQTVMKHLFDLKGDIIYIDHDRNAILCADSCIKMGPGSGNNGGEVVYKGKPDNSLFYDLDIDIREKIKDIHNSIFIKNANARFLKEFDILIPKNHITAITGVSGAGKSTLAHDVIYSSIINKEATNCKTIKNIPSSVYFIDQNPIGVNVRSNPATYIGLLDDLRHLFSEITNLPYSFYSFNRPEGKCQNCDGLGEIEIVMRYQASVWNKCPVCRGKRYSSEVLSQTIPINERHLSIADILDMNPIDLKIIIQHFKDKYSKLINKILVKLNALIDVGLEYIKIGQPSNTLSGGEAQRIKLAKVLGKKIEHDNLLLIDEPTTGLDSREIERFLFLMKKIKSKNNSIIIIEHNLDIIKNCDWIIELGPKGGKYGGELMFMGTFDDLCKSDTLTARAINSINDLNIPIERMNIQSNNIEILNAYANNLKHISVQIPKYQLTVVTGLSGSGKSTLIWDVIEAEVKRSFLESLSIYERYGIGEIKNNKVDLIKGIGLVNTISAEKNIYNPRSTVGSVTHINYYLANLFCKIGKKTCYTCNTEMTNNLEGWFCEKCKILTPYYGPEGFITSKYTGACANCQGVGTIPQVNIDKIIIHPEKPLLNGAMYSPGFFPKNFLGKPGNSGYYFLQSFSKRYNFNPHKTLWNEMSEDAKSKFIYGDKEPMEVTFVNTKGKEYTQTLPFPGFEGWLEGWDVGGAFTDHIECPICNGSGLKKEFHDITILGYNIHDMSNLTIIKLHELINKIPQKNLDRNNNSLYKIWNIIDDKLKFLMKINLSYLQLNRYSSTLSAGEAQRIILVTLLGNEMSNLVLLLDEPTKGLHCCEIDDLIEILKKIRDNGNTLIIVEQDIKFIKEADNIIEIGPKAGSEGGEIVYSGSFKGYMSENTVTTKYFNTNNCINTFSNKLISRYVNIKNAFENNLKIESLSIPLDCLVGVCGVSGSGKSSLIIDTIAHSSVKKNRQHLSLMTRCQLASMDQLKACLLK